MSEILKYLFQPINKNVHFFRKIQKLVIENKKLKIQHYELEKKISFLTKYNTHSYNKTLHGMRTRIQFLDNQIKKNDKFFFRIRMIMVVNFEITQAMFDYLKSLDLLDQVLDSIKNDDELLKILKEFRFAWGEFQGTNK